MQMTQLVGKLGRSDMKTIGRDRFLIFMFLFAVYIAVTLRYGLPWLNSYLIDNNVMPSDRITISLADLYPMLVAYMGIYTSALLVGTVFGFVLLDEKDQHTLRAMLVTPVPLNRYVIYRVGGPAILAFFVIIGSVLCINQALLPLWQLTLIAAGGALTAPIISLFFATFAENKVEGFAYSKFGGVSGWAFLLGWFVAEPWQWLIGLYPPFWIGKAYWLALEGRSLWWFALVMGIVLQCGLIYLLIQRFNKAAYK